MRYFIVILFLAAAGVVSLAGFRGHLFRWPPREIFPDMKRQPKLRPQKPNPFFADARSSRLPVPGTIARGAPFEDTP
ncbi:MAG: cytochrome c, partial [Kiritimatiellaeota bacterium]|nr:cytochrome c [Kiritimatiellota bacterium]